MKLSRVKGLGIAAVVVLVLGMDAIMPYRYDTRFEEASFHPPQWTHDYQQTNKGLKQYRVIPQSRVAWSWGVRAESYPTFWGSCDWHLFGRDDGRPLFLMGADRYGRDLFSRLLWAMRISLLIALLGVAVSFVLGMTMGGLAGYLGGIWDRGIMRICEVLMCFPFFFLMLALRGIFPSSMTSLQTYACIVLVMSVVAWPSLARVIRGMVLSLRERDSVMAMRCAGMGHMAMIRKYILPHTMSYALVAAALNIPSYILAEAGLSFLGLGIQEPYPSLGNMLQSAMSLYVMQHFPWTLWPGVALMILIATVFFICDRRVKL